MEAVINTQHIHILGICGTFMGSLAVLAKSMGFRVTGSDANVYPPMSTQLEEQGIEIMEGYHPNHFKLSPDQVIIGNALSRGNAAVEYILENGIPYTSGPQWLAQFVLRDKWVLGVAGTHGKTSTSAMLAWILEYAGLEPGFLIGGVTNNFSESARIGGSKYFVVEADEYDSAFFDKRSKFVHYAPRTAVLNNLEFDHADIFNNLEEIEKQFHHLIRTIPKNGAVIGPDDDSAIDRVLNMGCWSSRQQFGINRSEKSSEELALALGTFWNAELEEDQGSEFRLTKYERKSEKVEKKEGLIQWTQTGQHNVRNAMAAAAAAGHVGIDVSVSCVALGKFDGVKRRMELLGSVNGISVYDDFAHHPTAIKTTLDGFAAKLRSTKSSYRLVAVIEPRSATMKSGVHQGKLVEACVAADEVLWYQGEDMGLDFKPLVSSSVFESQVFSSVQEIVAFLTSSSRSGDHIIVMSNGGFEGIHDKLLSSLTSVGVK